MNEIIIEQQIIMIISGIIVIFIGSLIGAVLLRAASHWIAKLDVPFGRAYWTVFFFIIINSLLEFILGILIGLTSSANVANMFLVIMILAGFLIQSWIISLRLSLSFGKACLVNITMMGLALAIAFIIGIIVLIIMSATGPW